MLHQFRQNLPETPWMDSQTKEKAEEKVNAMTYEVGYPDFIEDPTKLDEYYVKVRYLKKIKLWLLHFLSYN